MTSETPPVVTTGRYRSRSRRLRRGLGFWTRVLLLAIAISVAMFPFLWMLRTSIAPTSEQQFQSISLLPDTIDFSNYTSAWTEARLGSAMWNGFVVTGAILVLQLLTVIPAAFAFAALQFRGRNWIFMLVLSSLLVPVQMTAVPNFITINQLGLVDSRWALVLPFVTSAFGIFLIRQQMLSIPQALIDAARSDGLSTGQMMRKVHVPLAMPAIAAFSVFSFYSHWNDYLWPLLVTRSREIRTPPLALALFQQQETGFEFGKLCAGAAIVTMPVVIAFLLAQRRFVEGIAGAEVVG